MNHLWVLFRSRFGIYIYLLIILNLLSGIPIRSQIWQIRIFLLYQIPLPIFVPTSKLFLSANCISHSQDRFKVEDVINIISPCKLWLSRFMFTYLYFYIIGDSNVDGSLLLFDMIYTYPIAISLVLFLLR